MADRNRLAKSDRAPTMILVAHHIEEIDPWIQNVMLLKDGKPLAQGRPDQVITSERMKDLLECSCSVFRQGNEFLLRVDV
jgi:iron complex transport system ATP-binding protein